MNKKEEIIKATKELLNYIDDEKALDEFLNQLIFTLTLAKTQEQIIKDLEENNE